MILILVGKGYQSKAIHFVAWWVGVSCCLKKRVNSKSSKLEVTNTPQVGHSVQKFEIMAQDIL
jgi:hypothetical protein